MKKFILNIAFLSGLSFVMSACQSEDAFQREGYIQFAGVQVDKTVQTRAAAAEQVAVDITTADGTMFKHADDWTTIQGESFLVPAGNSYNITAYSFGKEVTEGFDAVPCYKGTESVLVKANEAQNVTVTCKLAQSMVSVVYTDQFKTRFATYSAAITGNSGLSLPFADTETRAAYVKAGQPLNVTLTFTAKGSAQERQFTQKITDNALAANHYKVTFDVDNSGTGNISITVNQDRTEYEVALGIPTKPDGLTTIPIAGDNAKVWGKYAILDGMCSFVEPADPVQFKYKKATDATWQTVAAVKVGETNEYTAKVTALDFATQYQYKMVCGATEGDVCSFTTEKYVEIPNLNFDTWTQGGANWYANADASDSYWASGNTGVTSFLAGSNPPITTPADDVDAYKGRAAKLHTVTGIKVVGAAAGNLFIGSYKTNISVPAASVQFGRPYDGARPTRLSGYYKYSSASITHGSYPGNLTSDECNIYVEVMSGGQRIGFGEFVGKQNVARYTEFSFDITYTDPTKKADKIAIVATSSHYGGHFEGSKVTGQLGTSTLWVDEFTLSYD